MSGVGLEERVRKRRFRLGNALDFNSSGGTTVIGVTPLCIAPPERPSTSDSRATSSSPNSVMDYYSRLDAITSAQGSTLKIPEWAFCRWRRDEPPLHDPLNQKLMSGSGIEANADCCDK